MDSFFFSPGIFPFVTLREPLGMNRNFLVSHFRFFLALGYNIKFLLKSHVSPRPLKEIFLFPRTSSTGPGSFHEPPLGHSLIPFLGHPLLDVTATSSTCFLLAVALQTTNPVTPSPSFFFLFVLYSAELPVSLFFTFKSKETPLLATSSDPSPSEAIDARVQSLPSYGESVLDVSLNFRRVPLPRGRLQKGSSPSPL